MPGMLYGGDDGVSQHQQHLRRHVYRYLLFAVIKGRALLSPKLYDFQIDDVLMTVRLSRSCLFRLLWPSTVLLTQTGDCSRKSFICGSAVSAGCHYNAVNPLILAIPLAISSAVMLVSIYLYFIPGLVFSQQITFTARNIYRPALPLLSAFFDGALRSIFTGSSTMVRPLLKGNGLLVGIYWQCLRGKIFIPWERIK